MPLSPLFSFSFKVCVSLTDLRCKARAPTWTPSFRAQKTLQLLTPCRGRACLAHYMIWALGGHWERLPLTPCLEIGAVNRVHKPQPAGAQWHIPLCLESQLLRQRGLRGQGAVGVHLRLQGSLWLRPHKDQMPQPPVLCPPA